MDFLHGLLGASLRAVTVGVGFQVCFEDRFQYQLGRGLHHPVPNGRDPQGPLPAIGLRDHHPSHRLGPVARLDQLLPQLRQPGFPPLGLDPWETLAIHPRRSLLGFRQLVGVGEDILPMDLVIEHVEPVGWLLLRFGVQLPLKLPNLYRRFQTHRQSPLLGFFGQRL